MVVACSFPGDWRRTSGGPSERAKTGTEIVAIRLATIIKAAILPMSCFERFMRGYLRIFPHAGHEFSLVFVFGLHSWHGVALGFVVKICSFQIFSDRASRMIAARKMRAEAPRRWKMSQAVFTPCQCPIETRRIILRRVNA